MTDMSWSHSVRPLFRSQDLTIHEGSKVACLVARCPALILSFSIGIDFGSPR